MLSVIGLIGGLVLLIVLVMRGLNLFIAAPLCALVVGLTAQMPLFPTQGDLNFVSEYMNGFSGFIAAWFFMFLFGSIFGKVMENSGASDSVSHWIISRFGPEKALIAVIAACAVLTYGGVSLFVVAFSVYPMAVALFRQANLPRRFIPATIAFGSVTFTMTSAGSPEIQNWIPIEYLGTTPYAGWEVSLVVALFMGVAGYFWLRWMVNKAVTAGEEFVARDGDPSTEKKALPHPARAGIPLLVVLVVAFLLHDTLSKSALIVALLSGIAAVLVFNFKYFLNREQAFSDGAIGALIAIGNTAAVVGFGTVAKSSPAFAMAVDAMTGIPGDALIGAAVAVSVIAALTGSASGGQAIALPIIAPDYIDQGVNPDQLHRVVAISSGALDSLPHNGYVVTTIRAICQETHKAAYSAMGALTVVVPLVGTGLAILLFSLFG